MSARGRGRGGGTAKSDDRSSSSSNASSRNSSLSRNGSSSTTPSTALDTDRLMKELGTKRGAGSAGPGTVGPNTGGARKFVPNLSVSRNKTDTAATSSSSNLNHPTSSTNRNDTMNGSASQRGRGAGANQRGGSGNRGNFIQMEGIFQGNSQIPIASSSASGARISSSEKRENSASSIRTPNLKKLGITTTKTTLIGDVDGLKYEIDEEYEPRQIPIAKRKSVFDVKQEPGVGKLKESTVSSSYSHIDSFVHLFEQQKLELSKPLIKDEPMEPTTTYPPDLPSPLPSVIDPSQLILMQFPDVLPCVRTSSSKPELAALTDLPDGFLGKLQIFKSGKCRLKLNGDTYLDVDIGRPTSFLQNVMVTDMAATTTTGSGEATNGDMNKLVCLGDIKHKLIVSLNTDHVLDSTVKTD